MRGRHVCSVCGVCLYWYNNKIEFTTALRLTICHRFMAGDWSPIDILVLKFNIMCHIHLVRSISQIFLAKKGSFEIFMFWLFTERTLNVELTRVYIAADATWHFMVPIIFKLQSSIRNIFASYAPLKLNLAKNIANIIQFRVWSRVGRI